MILDEFLKIWENQKGFNGGFAEQLTDKVKIQFDKDYPLRLDYLVKDKMNLSFILAPRVSD